LKPLRLFLWFKLFKLFLWLKLLYEAGMAAKILAVVNQKDGVGKTILTM